ncbi:hypothetical protein [Mycolicibacterium farcinogenes]|uniref:Uncharacterized protein n=1 Tax=Mycolicibacterium farcinogenes TaxID=1802 RepID=A0ACD1FDA4_MYCFR|nr:hypothetical protein [Mycolicibacterium farcinogenes]QZH65048.1 hypothetical protein K6L26_24070 [Mycolicibacterium farcinogenes]
MTTAAKFAANLTLFLGLAMAASACGHSEEWEYGNRHRGTAQDLMRLGVSAESACRSVAGYGYGRTNDVINSQDAYDGCMAGLGR